MWDRCGDQRGFLVQGEMPVNAAGAEGEALSNYIGQRVCWACDMIEGVVLEGVLLKWIKRKATGDEESKQEESC